MHRVPPPTEVFLPGNRPRLSVTLNAEPFFTLKPFHGVNQLPVKGVSEGVKRFLIVITTAASLWSIGCTHRAYYPPPPPPPGSYSGIAQQGYHDGLNAANHDIRRGLSPDPARHPRFRRPPVPPPAFEDYRHAFRSGYDQVFRHGPPPPGY